MGFNNFNSSVKLNSVKTYKGTNKSSDVFKKEFYSNIKDMNYDSYEEVDYNTINEIEFKNTSTLGNNEKATSKNPEIKTKKEETKVKKTKKKKTKKPWYKKFLSSVKDYGVTYAASVVCGSLEVVENIGDCGAMIIGKVASATGNEKLKETMSDFVKKDWTEDLYQDIVKAADVDEDIANGAVHTVGNFIGTTAGYVATNFIPGGQVVGALVGAASAMGSTAEMTLNSGADFDTAFDCGLVAGYLGAGAGAALKEIQTAAKGATSLAGVAGYSLAGAGVSSLEPFANSVFQYNAYGKYAVDEDGNPLYNDYWDYYKESGALFQTVTAGAIGGSSTSFAGIKGYNNYKIVHDNINNMENLGAKSIEELQKRFEKMSSKQVYSVVENSNNEYFKSNLKTYDIITDKNAAEFIKFEGYNQEYKTSDFNLDWPKLAGYDPETISSIKNLIDSSPDGKIRVSRVGGDGGHALGTDWESTSSQRSIPSSSSNATAGIFDGNKYIEAVDVCSGTGDDISKVRQLVNLGYSKEVAEAMMRDFNSFDSLPEIGGKGGLNEVLKPNQKSKYGYSGKAASWKTPSVEMEGGAGQMNSIFSFGTLKKSGIITDLRNITI